MERLLEPWSRKIIQGAIQINKRLMKENRSWQELEDWIRNNPGLSANEQLRQVTRLKEESSFLIKTIVCPKCKKPMKGSDLYVDSEKYKDGYRSYWICGASCCANKGCGYEKFYRETVKELIGG